MDKNRFSQRGVSDTLIKLCQVIGEPYYKNGRVRQSFIAKKARLHQSLLSRIISGTTTKIDDSNVKKLAHCFGVTPAQMRGEEPIEALDGIQEEEDLEFIRRYREHPEELRRALRAFEAAWLKK